MTATALAMTSGCGSVDVVRFEAHRSLHFTTRVLVLIQNFGRGNLSQPNQSESGAT